VYILDGPISIVDFDRFLEKNNKIIIFLKILESWAKKWI